MRMRLASGVLIDYVEIRPRDLTVGDRVIVRVGRRFVVQHVLELRDVGSKDHLGGRYRYRVRGGWLTASPNAWIRIVVDG